MDSTARRGSVGKKPGAAALLLGGLLLTRGAWASWTTEHSMPSARGGSMAGVVNGTLYLAGGFNATDTPTLQAYDAGGNTWRTLASMPLDANGHGRYAGESDVINGLLYVVGGWQTYSNLPTSSLYVYNPAANSWAAKASLPPRGPFNSPLSACGVAGAIQGKLYVTTACDGINGYRAFLDVYDPVTDTWTHKADSPHAHYGPAGGVINGKLYVAGGSDASGIVSALDVYDPATDTWVSKRPMLTPRGGAAGAVVDSKLYVIGGATVPGTAVGTVEVYDPATDVWTSTTDVMITPRTSAAAGVVAGKVYVVGGNDAGGAIVSTNEMLDPGALPPLVATPTVTILAPSAGATVSGFAAITSSVTGSIGGVAYTLDGSGYLDAVLITAPYAFYWDTTKVANGTHMLTAGGWDKLTGQWRAGSPPVVVTVNNPVPPPGIPVPAPVPVQASTSVVVLTPAYGSTLSTSVVLTAQVTGDVGCVAYTLDGSGYLDACLVTPPYSFTWDASVVAPGTHTITAGAWDRTTGAYLVGSPPVVVGVPAAARALSMSCAVPRVVKQAGGGDCATISACIPPPGTRLTADLCVYIEDSATYAEQVTIQGVDMAGYRIFIGGDPGLAAPVVSPPASSTAAFQIMNASVTIANFNIVPTHAVYYGVVASSDNVAISSINLQDPGGMLIAHGPAWPGAAVGLGVVLLGAGDSISYSSSSTGGNEALMLGQSATATQSYFYSSYYPVQLNGGGTVTRCTIASPGGTPALGIYGANTISQSTITSTGAGAKTISVSGSGNVFANDFVYNPSGYGVYFNANTGNNTISLSSIAAGGAAYAAIYLDHTSSNVITQSYVSNSSGTSLFFNGADHNSISQSTITGDAPGPYGAVYMIGALSNTMTRDYVSNPSGYSLNDEAGHGNTVSLSTLTGLPNGSLFWAGTSGETLEQSRISGLLDIAYGTDNSVSQSTLDSLLVRFSSSNTVTGSLINAGAAVEDASSGTTISFSTIASSLVIGPRTTAATGTSTTTVQNCYISGSPAVQVSASTGTIIAGSTLVAAGVGDALYAGPDGNVNLSVTGSLLIGGASRAGLFLGTANTGVLNLASTLVQGSAFGLEIATQAPGAVLAFSSVTFQSLAPGATAVEFLGGVFVSTFSNFDFADNTAAVNVDGHALGAGSRVTMRDSSGARAGSTFEDDPQSVVDWVPDSSPGHTGACADPKVVKRGGGGDCTTISACLPAAGTTLMGDYCLSVGDSATYAEQVTIQGVTTAGFRLFIGASAGAAPVVSPPAGSTAAFLIANASVSIAGIGVAPANAVPYGILASSDDVVLSSVSVNDLAGWIRTAGVALQGQSALTGSTVAVQSAIAVKLSGDHDTVSFSVISSSGLGVTSNNYYDGTALVIGSSSNTVTDSYVSNPIGNASYILGGANYNSISRSTFTSGGGWGAMLLQAARFNTVTQSYLSYFHDAGDAYNTVTLSTMAGAYLDTSASDTITQCAIPGTLYMNLGSYNNVSQSDIGSLLLINSASNTVTRSFIDSGATIEDGSAWNTISYSTVAFVVIGPNHAYATGASTTTILDSYVWGSPAVDVFASTGLVITGSTLAGARTGTALLLGAGNTGVLTVSSVSLRGSAFGVQIAAQAPGAVLAFSSVTLQALAPGATGVQFLGGTFVSTFTGAVFADASIGADVDGSRLAAGSRVTMRDASGPRAGSLYEDDPRGLVDWVPDFSLPVGGLAAPSGVVLGVSSIAWTWAAAANALKYIVYASSSAAVLAQPAAPSFIETGLAPNTTASIMVAGVGGAAPGPLSPAATAFTLAQPPAGLAAFQVGAASAALAWSLNGNPAATIAELQRSTDAAAFIDVFLGAATGYADAGLLGCTTYTYRVRNVNWAGLPTAFAAPLAFETSATTPAAPAELSAVSLDGARIQLSWTPSPTEGVVAYRLYYGTAAVDYSSALMTLPPTAASTTTARLSSGVVYRFGLRAVHRCGVEEANTSVIASAPALTSASGVRAAIKTPSTGKRIAGNSVLVMAELTTGDPAQTSQVLFEYRPSGGAAWADLPSADLRHPNPDRAFPYFIQWDVTSVSSGSYDLRAVATDVFGSSDPAPGFITVVVDPVSPDLSVTDLGGGSRQTRQTVNAAAPNVVSAAEPATGLVSQVQLPAGALAASTATLTVTVKPAAAPPPAPGAQTVGSALEVELSNGQTRLAGGQTATLVFTYPDSSGDGIVDGTTLRADRLEVRSFDPVSGAWRKESATVVDKKARTITATTPHFSFFQVFGAVAADLSGVRLYPNPYKPHGGNPDEGHAYSPSDPVSGVVFDNLPASVEIKVYTLTGKLVASLGAANGGGALQWDARNSDGQDVASGGYFAVITSPGQSPVVMKLGIIR